MSTTVAICTAATLTRASCRCFVPEDSPLGGFCGCEPVERVYVITGTVTIDDTGFIDDDGVTVSTVETLCGSLMDLRDFDRGEVVTMEEALADVALRQFAEARRICAATMAEFERVTA